MQNLPIKTLKYLFPLIALFSLPSLSLALTVNPNSITFSCNDDSCPISNFLTYNCDDPINNNVASFNPDGSYSSVLDWACDQLYINSISLSDLFPVTTFPSTFTVVEVDNSSSVCFSGANLDTCRLDIAYIGETTLIFDITNPSNNLIGLTGFAPLSASLSASTASTAEGLWPILFIAVGIALGVYFVGWGIAKLHPKKPKTHHSKRWWRKHRHNVNVH